MTFLLIVKIILLIAALFMGIASIGANTEALGNRCVTMATVFTAALVALIMFEISRGMTI